MSVKIEKHVRQNVANWHYAKAIYFWLRGDWDTFSHHARIGDRLLGVRQHAT